MVDSIIQRGYRTNCAYFPETTFGVYNILKDTAYRVAGKVKGVSWQTRQNIIQTGNIGGGRNYTQQVLGSYDASASINFEVGDFSFFRFAVGDIAKDGSANAEATPYFLVDAELFGTDANALPATTLAGAVTSFASIRARPFSMVLYDVEQATGGTALVDTVDMLAGCSMSDFSISASQGSIMQGSANMIVKEVMHKRLLSQTVDMPDFTSATTMVDPGSVMSAVMTPTISQSYADAPPFVFYGGTVKIYDGSALNTLGQVTSFNYSWNNSLITYRAIGNRFIEMPQLGMRRQTLTANCVFRVDSTTNLAQGIPTGNFTNILELLKNYEGYASTSAIAATTVLRPAWASASTLGAGMQTVAGTSIVSPIEKARIELLFTGSAAGVTGYTTKGAKLSVRQAAVEGFGVPIQLENGMVEIPISFSVRGQPYIRTGDGSFSGYVASAGDIKSATYNPTLSWWYTA